MLNLTPSEQHAAARCQPLTSERGYFAETVRVEVREDGQWWPQAQGNTYAYLRERAAECEREGFTTRLVTWYGEQVYLP